jgi:hypothetical protein
LRQRPKQVAAARAAYAETRGKTSTPPPLDAEGDRGGIIPGDPIPSESVEDIRARFEAEADARSRSRAGLPTMATDDEPEEEPTRVYSGRKRRPTLMGGLAGVPMEQPRSDPSRTAQEYKPRRASPSSPTLVSPGTVPPNDGPDDGSVTVEAQDQDGRPLSEREGPKR